MMLAGLCLALVPSLLVHPPAGSLPTGHMALLSRRILLRSAAASVVTVAASVRAEEGEFARQRGFQDRSVALGSDGISAYQKLK